jgi:peptidoglycan/LPS O-acetylase OafA/YrhL
MAAHSSSERLHALDAVRGGALLLGVVVHLSMSFWPIPLWPIRDNDPSQLTLTAFLVAHIFRMSLFFLIAGFFSRMLFERRGALGFAKDRAKRIGIPFLVGWPLLFVAFIAVIIWHAAKANGGVMPEAPQGQPALTWRTVPLLHTWFLYVLLALYAGALALVGLFKLVDRGGHIGRALDAVMASAVKTQLAPVLFGLPLALFFFFKESWIMWGGVHTPDVGLAPNLQASVAYASAFGFGWLLHRRIDLLSVWKRWWPLHLAAAAGLSFVCIVYAAKAANPAAVADMGPLDRLVSSAVYPLAIWTWSFGLIGMAMTFLARENKAIRYLADSSYWIYLIHLPVVMVFQSVFSTVALPWFVKFPIMLVLSMAVMLASYQLLVRNTAIGGLLNGRRYPGPRKAKAETPAVGAPAE